LRTFDRYSPFPEEVNRTMTGKLATYHFAPTSTNVANLAAESITENVYLTGNTVIDALLSIVRGDYAFKSPALQKLDLQSGRVILMTAHRRENLGQPMRNIFEAVLNIVNTYRDVRVIYPVHKNPAVLNLAHEILGKHDRIHLIEPLDVDDMHNLMAQCHLILTDSGGIQEEAPSLGKPVLVLRTETERPEAVEAGAVKVVGVEKDIIIAEASKLLNDENAHSAMAKAVNPYGDGKACERIVEVLATQL